MPIYEYNCRHCGIMASRTCDYKNKPKWILCPACGRQMRPIISRSSFRMTGYREANGYSDEKVS
jgi:putative FmdB family regulatory protein